MRYSARVSVAETSTGSAVAETRLFRLLSDPTRLGIIELLATAPRSVADLVEALGVPRSRVSNHLACLRWCEIATATQVGRSVVYALADERVVDLVQVGRVVAEPHRKHLESCSRLGPEWL